MDRLAKEILKDVALEEIAPRAPKQNPVDHWSPAILLERAAYLKKLARFGDGSASETLREYPQHLAMLSFRSRDGDAEVHQNFADLFLVLAGTAALVTGGTVTHLLVPCSDQRSQALQGERSHQTLGKNLWAS